MIRYNVGKWQSVWHKIGADFKNIISVITHRVRFLKRLSP